MKVAQARIDAFRMAMNYVRFNYGWMAETTPGNNPFLNEELEWGINWGCAGTTNVEATRKCMAEMEVCIKLAEMLNSLYISIDWENRFDELIPDKECFDAYVQLLVKYIKEGHIDKINAFFLASNAEDFDDMTLDW